MVETDDAEYSPIGNEGSVIYLRSDLDAPNRRVVAVDLKQRDKSAWKTVVAERPQAIESATVAGGRIVAEYLVDVQSRLMLFGLDGSAAGEIKLPGAGSLSGISGRQDSSLLFYGFTSPLYPATIFSYDLKIRRQSIRSIRRSCRSTSASTKRGSCSPYRRTAPRCRSS